MWAAAHRGAATGGRHAADAPDARLLYLRVLQRCGQGCGVRSITWWGPPAAPGCFSAAWVASGTSLWIVLPVG